VNPGVPVEKVSRRLALQAARFPDKIFLVDLGSGRQFTFREFDGLVSRVCRFLETLGVERGDIISTVLANSAELALLFFAALRFGIVLNPYPAFFIAADLRRDTDILRPKVILAPEARREDFEPLGSAMGFIDAGGRGEFIESLGAFPPDFPEAPARSGQIAFIYHSAGRLIDPRGIRYSHGNLASLIPSVARGLNLRPDDVHLIVLPLAHTAALNYSLFPGAWLGATVILAESFWNIRERFWRLAGEFSVSYAQVVPTVLYILHHQPARSRPQLRLPYLACGSAPLSPSLRTEFESAFTLPVADLYGLAETGPTHADAIWMSGWKRGTIGRPLDVNEVAILDDDGEALPCGAAGEIAVRGGNVFPGYAVNPGLTAGHFRNGWFLTGDRGLIDEDGYHHFLGLKKTLIIRGGINIHPGEIDEVLGAHPEVEKVSTRGTPDDFFGELIRCEVSVREGSRLTEAALKEFCRGRLSPIKVPDLIKIS
jgi:long-chain acyl-CoA synthetase